jgi:outer membrane protein assembly factor BamB
VGSDGTIYQTLLFDSHLYAIEPETGAIRWSVDLLDTPAIAVNPKDFGASYADGWSEPALGADGTIYVSLDDPYLRALDPNGTIKWATKLGDMGGFTLTVDRVGIVYAACDDGNIYVVGPDGQQVGHFATDGWPAYPVIASDGTLIATDARDYSLLITEAGNAVQALSIESLSGALGQ